MIDQKKRDKIINRLGLLGNMVVDLGGRLVFPVENPEELARQFPETQKIIIGINEFPAAQIALQIPEEMFPIKSFENLVEKLEKIQLKEIPPASFKEVLSQQPLIGFKVRRDDEFFRRGTENYKVEMGGPGDTPPTVSDELKPAEDLNPERSEMAKKLGPLGDMVLELIENIRFPLRNQMELSRQFTEEEKIILGSNELPIAQIALMLPDELFPLKSKEELVDKLADSEFKEINPSNLQFLLNQGGQVGLLLETDEEELKKRAEKYPMEFGGPEKPPSPSTRPPELEDQTPERTRITERLGPIGEMVYDITEQRMTFPIKDPPALAAKFKEKDCLLIGINQFPLAKLALRMPETIFPIKSIEDLTSKLEEEGINDVSVEQLAKFIDELDSDVGYSSPYNEEELQKMAREFEMVLGGPEETSPEKKDK